MTAVFVGVVLTLSMWLLPSTNAADTGPCTSTHGSEAYIQNIPEDSPVGSIISTVFIRGNTSQVSLLQAASEYFSLDVLTRNITLTKALDVDKGTNTYYWNIHCWEKEVLNPRNHTIAVKIIATDVNDNGPVFQFPLYEAFVHEDLKIGDTVYEDAVATDADLPGTVNSKVYYFVMSGKYSEYFAIANYDRPTISLRKRLDYESLQTLNITVLAKDRYFNETDVRSSTTVVTVNVIDVDDEIPTFEQTFYSADVGANPPPNTPVKVLPRIAARDLDIDVASPVWYSLLDPRENFHIHNETGEITTTKLISAGIWTICVQAHQVDNEKRYGTALLDINVKGVNINAPTFPIKTYTASVSENTKKGGTVINVVAQDPDVGTVLDYSLEDLSGVFTIDSSGYITLLQPLDYESVKAYRVLVKASDNIMEATAHVNITVIDENDNNPIIIIPTDAISLDRELGTLVTDIQATDADENTVFSYSISTPHSRLFSINEQGALYVSVPGDQIEKDSYDITVVVTDNGEPPREASAVLTALFPRAEPLVVQAGTGFNLEYVAVGLGILSGVLLVFLVILIVYSMRRRQRDRENLDKAKLNNVRAPKGLAFTQKRHSEAHDMDLAFGVDGGETLDGATTVQDNPLLDVDDGINYAYMQNGTDSSPDNGDAFKLVDEIEIQTSIYPMKNGYKYHPTNGSVFLHEGVTSFKDTSSCESINSSNMNTILMPTHDGRNGITQLLGSKRGKQRDKDVNAIDPDRSVVPLEEKPEITVYF